MWRVAFRGFLMRHLVSIGLAAMLSASFAPAPAVLAAPPATQSDTHKAAALELAKLVNESNDMAGQVEKVLASIAAQAFSTDPNLVALKEEYPGVEKLFLDTMRPIMMDELQLMLPDYNAAVGAFFASNFTMAEIGELTAFWRSDAGQALMRSVSGHLDFAATSKELVGQMSGDQELQVSGASVDADKRKAVTRGVRDLTPGQRVAVMRFGLTPTGRKMQTLVEQKNEIDRQWANRELSPGAEARIEHDIGEALVNYIEAEERKRSAAQ